jgi:DnaJ-class molecular chaperone
LTAVLVCWLMTLERAHAGKDYYKVRAPNLSSIRRWRVGGLTVGWAQVLGIRRNADDTEIKKAVRKCVEWIHPLAREMPPFAGELDVSESG